jgi:hypothetical protein
VSDSFEGKGDPVGLEGGMRRRTAGEKTERDEMV